MPRPRKLSDILHMGAGTEKFHEQLAHIRVLREWEDVVGPKIAKVTRPSSFRNGTLTVGVRGAVWKSEIDYLKDGIVAALNERLGRSFIANLRLTSAYLPAKGAKPAEEEAPTFPKDDGVRLRSGQMRKIAHAVAAVTDLTLREAIAAAWGSKKRLDERKRIAGWHPCRACGQYEISHAGVCRACAIDISGPWVPSGGFDLGVEGKSG